MLVSLASFVLFVSFVVAPTESACQRLSGERNGSPSRRDDRTIGKTYRSPTLVHPIVCHVFRATVHCLEAGMWHRLSNHEGHEEHEGNQSTNRVTPSFSSVTLKFISSPTLISANLI